MDLFPGSPGSCILSKQKKNQVQRRTTRIPGTPILPYRIEYSPETIGHLKGLTAGQRTTVLDAVDEQLAHQPTVETRNRKPMRPNPLALWELRIGEIRVYYDVDD
ncbi:MAG TPA: hypothetical protein VLT87_14015, partial [Thermoanaerobaculia bacterium]|nr:hypothetical protein [Thermoanaerobaculia bacterium]